MKLSFLKFLLEKELPWEKDPKIGWWRDQPKHYTMYHGTHKDNVKSVVKNGISVGKTGPTKGRVSMTHDPHTAHAYASMGGESAFRAAGAKAKTIPHADRRVIVAHIPHDWAHQHMDPHMRGNVGTSQNNLKDKSKYDAHKASGKQDQEYYQTTELRFKKDIPSHFIKGVMKKS